MKINNQKMKVPTNTQMLKINHSNNINAISPPTPHCSCLQRLDKIQQQICSIEIKIMMIVKCIEIPKFQEFQKQKPNQQEKLEIDKSVNTLKLQQQKQTSEESFLLEGIDGSINQSYRQLNLAQKQKFEENHHIGNYISKINDKMRQIQEKVEQMGKIKNNVSLMAKIIEQMEKKYENSSVLLQSFKQSKILQQKVSQNSLMIKSKDEIKSNGERSTIKPKRNVERQRQIQHNSLSKVRNRISQQHPDKRVMDYLKKQDNK